MSYVSVCGRRVPLLPSVSFWIQTLTPLLSPSLPPSPAVGMVDTIFADVAQPDQARIVSLNAHYFLKNGGHVVVSVKASCIDSTAAPEAVFQKEVCLLPPFLPPFFLSYWFPCIF